MRRHEHLAAEERSRHVKCMRENGWPENAAEQADPVAQRISDTWGMPTDQDRLQQKITYMEGNIREAFYEIDQLKAKLKDKETGDRRRHDTKFGTWYDLATIWVPVDLKPDGQYWMGYKEPSFNDYWSNMMQSIMHAIQDDMAATYGHFLNGGVNGTIVNASIGSLSGLSPINRGRTIDINDT